MVDYKRENLVPSSDLAEFYKNKIAIHLANIDLYKNQVYEVPFLAKKINYELNEIYIMVLNNLEKNKLFELITTCNNNNKKINELKPFKSVSYKNKETNDKGTKRTLSHDYESYFNLLIEKQILINKCLSELGFFGHTKIESKRLR